jgi:hypothetical protein
MTRAWTKLTAKQGHTIFVNLENAITVTWNELQKATIIAFAGGSEDVIIVNEKPEMVLSDR